MRCVFGMGRGGGGKESGQRRGLQGGCSRVVEGVYTNV